MRSNEGSKFLGRLMFHAGSTRQSGPNSWDTSGKLVIRRFRSSMLMLAVMIADDTSISNDTTITVSSLFSVK